MGPQAYICVSRYPRYGFALLIKVNRDFASANPYLGKGHPVD